MNPGDPLVISAATFNALIDAAREAKKGPRLGGRGAGISPVDPAVTVYVKNTTGSTLLEWSVVKPTAYVIDPHAVPFNVSRTPVFEVSAPGAATDLVLLTVEPIAVGKIGRAIAAGVAVASVNVTNTAHRYAVPVATQLLTMDSADDGPARLMVAPAATGVAKRLVLLGAPPVAAGGAAVTSWKNVVRVATTAAGTLASSFENGDTVDGVVLVTGNDILIKNQASGGENGIYTVNASGAPTRRADADAGTELVGATVFVSEGTVNKDTIWACTTNASITIGTTATVWVKIYPAAAVDLLFNSATATNYTITTSGVDEDVTGATLALPTAGTYLLTGVITGTLECFNADTPYRIGAYLYDNTAASTITGTSVTVVNALQPSPAIITLRFSGSGAFSVLYSVASGRTLKLVAGATGFTPPHMVIATAYISWTRITGS